MMKRVYTCLHLHLATHVAQTIPELLPHHAGAQTWIVELVNQAGCVVSAEYRVLDSFHQRQVLDALSSPVSPDAGAGYAPDFFGIGFEEPVE